MHSNTIIAEVSKSGQWSLKMVVVAFVLANLWDSVSTYGALSVGAAETNPILVGLMEVTTVPVVLALKVFIAVPLAILIGRWKPRALVIVTLLLCLAALNNMVITWSALLT